MSSIVNFTTLLSTATPPPVYHVIPAFIPSSSSYSSSADHVPLRQPGEMHRYLPFTVTETQHQQQQQRRLRDHPFRSFDSDTQHARRHRGQKSRANIRQRSRELKRLALQQEEEEDKKSRRSLNVADPEREKTIQLMKWRKQAFIEVDQFGEVRTTKNRSSLYTMLLLIFWCDLSNTCPRLKSFDPSSRISNSFNWSSHVVMYFNHTDRYLCVNEQGRVYTQRKGDPQSDIRECIFDHDVITKQYDVYRVVRYPESKASCSSLTNRSSTEPATAGRSQSRLDRLCQGSWYLGVSRNNSVRVVRSTRRLPPPKTFFYQSWVHKQLPRGSSHHLTLSHPSFGSPVVNSPFALSGFEASPALKAKNTSSTSPPTSRDKAKSKSRPAFALLSGVSRRRSGGGLVSGTDSTRSIDCGSNLLSNCQPNRSTNIGKSRLTKRLRRHRQQLTENSSAATEP